MADDPNRMHDDAISDVNEDDLVGRADEGDEDDEFEDVDEIEGTDEEDLE